LGDRDPVDGVLRLSRAKSYQDPVSTNKLIVVAYICNPSYMGAHRFEDHSLRPAPGQNMQDTICKITKAEHERLGGMAQVVEAAKQV
jgi:hypothetical protein